MSTNLHISFAAMTAIAATAEGLFLNALLTLKAENSLIFLVGSRIPSVHDGMAINFTLENISKK
jgi:hypothetical protein